MTRKTVFFKGCPWFKFNNLGLALGMALKFYTSVRKGLKPKDKKFCGLIHTFVEVTGEKLVGGSFCSPLPILNKVNVQVCRHPNNILSHSNVFCKNLIFSNFIFLQKNTCARVVLNKIVGLVGLRSATLLKSRLWHRGFLGNFQNFLIAQFL